MNSKDDTKPNNAAQRRYLLVAAAATAGAAGMGYEWWQNRLPKPTEGALGDLWDLNLSLPSGQSLNFASLRGKPLVLNFWATWCPPCVEELPLLERFYQQNKAKGWQVVGIAADNAKAVLQFLGKMPLSFPTPLAGLAGIELSKNLGNVSGGLPFTVVVDSAGQIAQRHMGKLHAAQLDAFLTIR